MLPSFPSLTNAFTHKLHFLSPPHPQAVEAQDEAMLEVLLQGGVNPSQPNKDVTRCEQTHSLTLCCWSCMCGYACIPAVQMQYSCSCSTCMPSIHHLKPCCYLRPLLSCGTPCGSNSCIKWLAGTLYRYLQMHPHLHQRKKVLHVRHPCLTQWLCEAAALPYAVAQDPTGLFYGWRHSFCPYTHIYAPHPPAPSCEVRCMRPSSEGPWSCCRCC